MEDLLRELAPQVLGVLARRYGQFDACEDAVQEALLAAAVQWPQEGVPQQPRGWLLTVARRSLVDGWRSDSARRRREDAVMRDPTVRVALVDREAVDFDDTLTLLFLCCHPALPAVSQLALTLRAVGGLTTTEIASAFLVPEATMAKRITRAKRRLMELGPRFELPPVPQRAERLGVVLSVLYLIFTEGHTATSGRQLFRTDLTGEAIRLARLLHRLLPKDGEVAGLLALMLLSDARRPARTDAAGSLVPLEEQHRDLWNAGEISEGLTLLTSTLGRFPIGPYQVQAAIAAVHDEAPTADATDWPQILALYDVLERLAPGPLVTLSRAVAVANVHGARAGLALLGTLATDERATRSHRYDAVRAHLLEQAGDLPAARECYLRAASMTASIPEQRYLTLRAAKLATPQGGDHSDRPGGLGSFGSR